MDGDSTMRNLTMSLISTLLAALFGNANAHEFWIQPESYSINSDQVLRLSLMHGERFLGDPVTRNNGYIQRFECVGVDATTDIRGLDGHTTSFARPSGSGGQILVYHSQEFTNMLEAGRFRAYLREEGLDGIIQRRAELGESDMPGRETYSRCAKSLITIGDAPIPADRAVGLPLELVLGAVGPDGAIHARVLLHGTPAPGLRVVAVRQADPSEIREAITDQNGAVQFQGGEAGAWMLTSLHMERATNEHTADWRSYWASLTMHINRKQQ